MKEIDAVFGETTKLLLGVELAKIDDYTEWLGRRVPLPSQAKSALSGKEVWIPPSFIYLRTSFNKSKIISMEEMERVTTSPFTAKDVTAASFSQLSSRLIKPVAFYVGNFRYQTFENVEKVSGGGGGRNLYFSEDVYHDVKNLAYCNYTLFSQNVFGSHNVTYSQFCIHAYNSTSVSRCFEVDGCSSSRDLLFCHNCENVSDSMFCFNAKNLKNAIGNIPVPQAKYREIKALVLADIRNQLLQTRKLEYDIFDIGDRHG
ncbi:MAG: hypothetical protein PHF60_05145 [Candidatus ainarchaeum sp.]|nr:hypothetical protein [Candidatus ainarchaeum sp.]